MPDLHPPPTHTCLLTFALTPASYGPPHDIYDWAAPVRSFNSPRGPAFGEGGPCTEGGPCSGLGRRKDKPGAGTVGGRAGAAMVKPHAAKVKMSMGDRTKEVEADSEEHAAMVWLRRERTSRGHVMVQELHREVPSLSPFGLIDSQHY